MVRSAVMLSRVYPVDRELLLAGTALHDIGKLSELETDNLGVADYSVDGNLFGHSLIGCEMVTKAASKNIYDEEKVRLLKHMIASHHGTLEQRRAACFVAGCMGGCGKPSSGACRTRRTYRPPQSCRASPAGAACGP